MKVTWLLKIDVQANWDEKYLTQVGYFFSCKRGKSILKKGKKSISLKWHSHQGEMYLLI